jgi:hypothetical protein
MGNRTCKIHSGKFSGLKSFGSLCLIAVKSVLSQGTSKLPFKEISNKVAMSVRQYFVAELPSLSLVKLQDWL